MSRTTRACPDWARDYDRVVKSVGYDAVGRNRFRNGYDRRYSKDLYQPFADGPKGYDTWEHVPSGRKSKRAAKRGVSRLLRIRAQRDIRSTLRDDA